MIPTAERSVVWHVSGADWRMDQVLSVALHQGKVSSGSAGVVSVQISQQSSLTQGSYIDMTEKVLLSSATPCAVR